MTNTITEERIEHEAWLALCEALKASGAVTQADCDTPVNAREQTAGQRVFNRIREWGTLLADLHVKADRMTRPTETADPNKPKPPSVAVTFTTTWGLGQVVMGANRRRSDMLRNLKRCHARQAESAMALVELDDEIKKLSDAFLDLREQHKNWEAGKELAAKLRREEDNLVATVAGDAQIPPGK